LAADTLLGALTGACGALTRIGFLAALPFVLFVVGLQALFGPSRTAMPASRSCS
jgi:hypothetical protein